MENELEPPDLKQCQVEVPNGHSFMSLGGKPGRVRCTKKPSYLATERFAGKDGQFGSMTMCADCFLVFIKQADIESYNITTIKEEG